MGLEGEQVKVRWVTGVGDGWVELGEGFGPDGWSFGGGWVELGLDGWSLGGGWILGVDEWGWELLGGVWGGWVEFG